MDSAIIQFEQVHFAYPEGPPVLQDISLRIPAGQTVALIGINGSGKSTLLRHLIGLNKPTQGLVTVKGLDTQQTSTANLARHVGFAFQKPEHQLFAPTVRDEIAFGPRNLGLSGAALNQRVTEILNRFDLGDLAEHPPAVMSFSHRRVIALASVAALHPTILALDEPLVGLDGAWRRRVIAWFTQHSAAGGTILLATHHLRLAAKADRVLLLHEGYLLADGPPQDVFSQPDLLAAAGLTEPFSVALGREMALPEPALRIRDILAAIKGCAPEDIVYPSVDQPQGEGA